MKKIIPILTTLVVSLSLFSNISYAENETDFEEKNTEAFTAQLQDNINTFKKSEWHSPTVTTVYAPDGRTAVIDTNDVEAWKNVGWYTIPVVTMYAPDGRTAVVDKNDVDAWKNVGWFESAIVAESAYVNSAGLSSETEYLVWVSKSEFKLRVYMGSKGNWNLINTFT